MDIPVPESVVEFPDNNNQIKQTYPKPNWTSDSFVKYYINEISILADSIPDIDMDNIESDNALSAINELCDNICIVLHEATAKSTCKCTPPRGCQRKKWWSTDCTRARDKNRFYHSLWKEAGCPTQGQLYISYKEARKSYRNVCRTSVNKMSKEKYNNLNKLCNERRSRKFWNLIRKTKKQNKSQNNFITVEKLSNHFSNKFTDSKTVNEFIRLADVTVSKKYEKLCDSSVNNPRLTVSVQSVVKYIKQLNTYCSPGIDGISSEHLIYALDSTVILYISKLLSLCVTFGIVPDSFSKGLMIPVLKKNNIDPSTPKNYRPITISTTFSKLLELYILEMSSGHSFDPMQFGFVEGRGTAMAISLATDVSQLCNAQNSPTFMCSLDAEGAFDGIPHSIIFMKAIDVIPDACWRILYYWYKRMEVYIQLDNKRSTPISIQKGTRQGGLSSSFLLIYFMRAWLKL